MSIDEVVDARKARLDSAAVWELLAHSDGISVAKGKKVQNLQPTVDGQAEILKQVMGPSGNLRAPAFRVGNAFVIGFHAELYEQWLQGKGQ